MKRCILYSLTLGIYLGGSSISLAQQHAIDSLKGLLNQNSADTNRVRTLLELARTYVIKPGEYATDLDYALRLVRQAYGLSRRLQYTKGMGQSYLIGGQAYREKGKIQQARAFDEQAITWFTKSTQLAGLAAAYMELGNTFGNSELELKQKIHYYQLAQSYFHQTGNREREATTLRELADFYHLQQQFPKAIHLLHQSIALYKQIHYSDLQGVYHLLGTLYTITGDSKSGLHYGLLALKTAEHRKDTSMQVCTIYNRIGLTYYDLNELKLAKHYFEQAFQVANRYQDVVAVGFIAGNLGMVYFHLGEYKHTIAFIKDLIRQYPSIDLARKTRLTVSLMRAHLRLNQVELAQHYCNEVIAQLAELRKLNREQEILTLVYGGIIDFYIKTHQLSKAKPLFKRYYEHSMRIGDKRIIANSFIVRFRLDSAQGDYLAAIAHLKTYNLLQDSLLNEQKNKAIARLQVEFDTERKEQQLKLKERNIQLLTKETQIQQASLLQQTYQRNSLLGGAGLLVALLGLGYNRYRLKQRSNQQLQAKQRLIDQKNQDLQDVLLVKEQLLEEREWMLKEIHHRVKNNLQVISSMLNSQFDFLSDPTALTAIRESQNRVQVMALIHQKLYQSDNLAQIHLPTYIYEIVDYLIDSFDRFTTVHPQVNITELYLDVSLATPLGLIINEAVTNTLKYAFPENRPGTVIVRLVQQSEQTYRLTISDDGVGFPAGLDIEHSPSLGLSMIRGLSKQLKGVLTIISENGVEMNLEFKTAQTMVNRTLKTANGVD